MDWRSEQRAAAGAGLECRMFSRKEQKFGADSSSAPGSALACLCSIAPTDEALKVLVLYGSHVMRLQESLRGLTHLRSRCIPEAKASD